MQALALFLDCCRHRAIQPLAAATKSGLSQSALQELLTNLAATVQVPPYTVHVHMPIPQHGNGVANL